MQHSHLHQTLGVSVDKSRVAIWAVIAMLIGYAFSALMSLMLGGYSDVTRFFVASIAIICLYLTSSVIVNAMRFLQQWLEDLEQRSFEKRPEDVGMGTRLLLMGFKRSSDDTDDEEAVRFFSASPASFKQEATAKSQIVPNNVSVGGVKIQPRQPTQGTAARAQLLHGYP